MIIGVSGKAGSGKDTVSDFLVKDHGFAKVALADPMKRFCQEIFDFSEEQLWGKSEKRNEGDKRYQRERREDDYPRDSVWICRTCWQKQGEKDDFFQDEDDYRDGAASHCYSCGSVLDDKCELVPPDWFYFVPHYLTPRYALQTLGTEWGRDCYSDVWVDYALRVAKKLDFGTAEERFKEERILDYDQKKGVFERLRWMRGGKRAYEGVVISDCRFKNELAAIKKVGKVVRVKRGPGFGPSGARAQHLSETEQDGIPDDEFDFVFENNGALDDIRTWVNQLVEKVNSGR